MATTGNTETEQSRLFRLVIAVSRRTEKRSGLWKLAAKSDGDRAVNVSRRMGEGIKGGLDAIGSRDAW